MFLLLTLNMQLPAGVGCFSGIELNVTMATENAAMQNVKVIIRVAPQYYLAPLEMRMCKVSTSAIHINEKLLLF